MNNKEKMLNLMEVDDHVKAVEAVLGSGLLPDPQLQQWLNQMVERAIRRSLGKSGCPEWETWAAKWLSGEDRTAEAAEAVARAARAASEAAAEAAEAVARAAAEAAAAEVARIARAAAAEAAEAAADVAAADVAAADVAAADVAAARAAAWAAAWAARAAAEAWEDERKAQFVDLLNLIKQDGDEFN